MSRMAEIQLTRCCWGHIVLLVAGPSTFYTCRCWVRGVLLFCDVIYFKKVLQLNGYRPFFRFNNFFIDKISTIHFLILHLHIQQVKTLLPSSLKAIIIFPGSTQSSFWLIPSCSKHLLLGPWNVFVTLCFYMTTDLFQTSHASAMTWNNITRFAIQTYPQINWRTVLFLSRLYEAFTNITP